MLSQQDLIHSSFRKNYLILTRTLCVNTSPTFSFSFALVMGSTHAIHDWSKLCKLLNRALCYQSNLAIL